MNAGPAPLADSWQPSRSPDRLAFTLFLAAVLHAMVVLGVRFTAPEQRSVAHQLDITLAVQPSELAPPQAQQAAAAHQLASGNAAAETRLTSSQRAQMEMPFESMANSETEVNAASDQSRSRRSEANEARRSSDARAMPEDSQARPRLASQQMLAASPLANWDNSTQLDSNAPRVRRISALSAQRSEDAAYLLAWRQRVEDVGNRFYPEASRRYGIYGSLDVLTVIDQHGQLLRAEILRSSGHAVLDEAALRIIRMAAPFPAFPPELRVSTDQLEIVRSWHFQDNAMQAVAQ